MMCAGHGWTFRDSGRGENKRIVFDTGEFYMSPGFIEEQEIVNVREIFEQLRIILN